MLQNGALWDKGLVYCGICATGPLRMHPPNHARLLCLAHQLAARVDEKDILPRMCDHVAY